MSNPIEPCEDGPNTAHRKMTRVYWIAAGCMALLAVGIPVIQFLTWLVTRARADQENPADWWAAIFNYGTMIFAATTFVTAFVLVRVELRREKNADRDRQERLIEQDQDRRDRDADRRELAQERRSAQAKLVTCWYGRDLEEGSLKLKGNVHIYNASTGPIHDLALQLVFIDAAGHRFGAIVVGEVETLPPQSQPEPFHVGQWDNPFRGTAARVRAALWFRDSADALWVRDDRGVLKPASQVRPRGGLNVVESFRPY